MTVFNVDGGGPVTTTGAGATGVETATGTAETVSVYVAVAVPEVLVAVIVNIDADINALGVPEITPVEVLKESPPGSVETEYELTVPPVELTPYTGMACPIVIDPDVEVSVIAGATISVDWEVAALNVPIPAALTAANLKLYWDNCNNELKVKVDEVDGACE